MYTFMYVCVCHVMQGDAMYCNRCNVCNGSKQVNEEQKLNVPYKQAHLNHPSTIWTRQCRANYRWLYLHMLALGYEYTKRYGKTHASIVKCEKFLNVPPVHIPDGDFCEPPQAMPDQYKVPGCSITAYWNYYEGEKYTVANKDEMIITRNDL